MSGQATATPPDKEALEIAKALFSDGFAFGVAAGRKGRPLEPAEEEEIAECFDLCWGKWRANYRRFKAAEESERRTK